jgi:hypothetical protein
MSETKSPGDFSLLANKVAQGNVPLGLMRTFSRFRLCRKSHGRQIKDEQKEIRFGSFTLDGSSHHTGDAAFTHATIRILQHPRANTDSKTSHNTQHTRAKRNTPFCTQKGTQPSQVCSGWHIAPNPIQN